MSYTPNLRALLERASEISQEQGSTFVGTEHFLAALLDHPRGETAPRILSWPELRSESLLQRLREQANSYMSLTAGTALDVPGRSASLRRALQLATHLRNPAGSEHVFFALLLAPGMDGVPNAVWRSLERAGAEPERMLERLRGEMPPDTLARLGTLPPRGVAEFGIFHDPRPISAGAAAAAKNPAQRGGGAAQIRDTHWALRNVLCGSSACAFDQYRLRELVRAGVSTFVCLQTSYNEYHGCSDYRETLRSMAASDPSFPSHQLRFLHAPVPDHSVLSDSSLLSLIAELKLLLDQGETLYVHCMGGHGRTGTVLTNLISSVEGVPAVEAFGRFLHRHRGRCGGGGGCSLLGHGRLEAHSQDEQTERAEGVMKRGNELGKKK